MVAAGDRKPDSRAVPVRAAQRRGLRELTRQAANESEYKGSQKNYETQIAGFAEWGVRVGIGDPKARPQRRD
jgi:hypothetical protein